MKLVFIIGDASKKIMKRATDDYEKLMKEMFEAGNADKE